MAKILIVDDDPDIVESLKVVLEDGGHEVVTASSGEEGKKKAGMEKPGLIILDVMMESIDKGFEVSRSLKRMPGTKDIPILMLTAIKEVTDINFNAGNTYTDQLPADYFTNPDLNAQKPSDAVPVDAFYEKPIKPVELLRKVKLLLEKK
jgi:CheY-like chemotaxis protein